MTTSLFDEPPSIASFQEYPSRRPFINSNQKRSGKAVKAYPETSSEAVLSALRGLQDKIRNLELDRSKAEKNLKVLAAETSAYKTLLQQPPPSKPNETSSDSSSPVPNRQLVGTAQIESQLRNADARCELLERQLDNMRRMVQSAERERSDALERQIALERDRGRITAENRSIQSKLEKMEFIQTRFDDLASRKEKSEARIKELEQKLQEEEHRRLLLTDRAAQLQTDAETKRILKDQKKTDRKVTVVKKKKKRSMKSRPVKKVQPVRQTSGQPHYRLNLADVPFLTGTSTSPSHAVSANMQRLLHDLKQHNPVYCNDQVVQDSSNSSDSDERGRSRVRVSSTEEDLRDLLSALQDEFGKMTFEHQILVKQIAETYDNEIEHDLQQDLDALVLRMERKGEQISTVKRHIEQIRKPQVPTTRSCSGPRVGPVRIGTRFTHSASPRNRPGGVRDRKLALLRDMRAIRTALHHDDLSWD